LAHSNPETVLILSGGSPLVPDLEETCARAGITIAAIVTEDAKSQLTINAAMLCTAAALPDAALAHPIICPAFTPGRRQADYNAFLRSLAVGQKPGMATVIDPSATVAGSTNFGSGCWVNAGCVIGAQSQFGKGCLINRSCSIGHHVEVGDFVSFGPGAVLQGDVTIGKGAMIGANATVIEYVTLGENCVVAAGSVVTRDVPENSLVRGNPARIVKTGIAGYRDVAVE